MEGLKLPFDKLAKASGQRMDIWSRLHIVCMCVGVWVVQRRRRRGTTKPSSNPSISP